ISQARLHLARMEPGRAEPLLRHALEVRRRSFPESDWRVAVAESLLGATLTSLSRFDEAEPLLVHALLVLNDIPGQQGREAEATRLRLAALHEVRGRSDGAGGSTSPPHGEKPSSTRKGGAAP